METGTTRTACRTSSGWRRASPAPTSSAAATGRSCSSAGRRTSPLFGRVLRGGAAGRLRADGRRQRLPPGGVRRVRPHDPPRPPAERRARVPPPGDGRGRTSRCAAARSSTGSSSRGRARSASRSASETIRADEVILCGGAINSPQLLQLSGVGNARELEALGVAVVHDLPGVGENLQDHLEVYVQYACTQPVSVQPALKKWRRPLIGAQLAVPPQRAGRDEPLRGGRLRPLERRRRVPEPHVPLPAARDPLRRLRAGCGARLPGARRPDVLGRARLGEDHDRPTRARIRRCASTTSRPTQDRREWVEAIQVRAAHPRPAGVRAVQRRRDLAGRRRSQSDEEILDWVARDAETALHPSCTCADGRAVVDPATMRVHGLDGCGSSTRRCSRTSRTGTSTRP